MTILDAILVAVLAGSVFVGYRRGALLQVLAYLGLAAGLVAGAIAAPRVASLASSPASRAALALGTLLVGGAVGDGIGWVLGSQLRARTHGTRLRALDAAGGSVVSAAATLLAIWFLALNLVNGPFPTLAREIRDSKVVRAIDAVMPRPPSLIGEVRQVLNLLGFPDVFVGLPPQPAAPVKPPTNAAVRRASRAAAPSTVSVEGTACGIVVEGSGFVAEPGLVLTNAHVVAGVASPTVREASGASVDAIPVAYDPRLDLAVLRVSTPGLTPLALVDRIEPRGTGGAVLGFPGGGPLTVRAGGVRRALEAVGRDIYGNGQVRREIYELQTRVLPGNSGGPFVTAGGEVAGVVFAASTTDSRLGYAIASTEVEPILRRAENRSSAVSTGGCVD